MNILLLGLFQASMCALGVWEVEHAFFGWILGVVYFLVVSTKVRGE